MVNNQEYNYEEIIGYLGIIYVLIMISLCFIYLWTMFNQYKNAHDQWYDIKRDYDLSPRNERYKTPDLKEE